jgi:predicted unusual protein kinase regulating ubiquinone biosynthesis (AarF/ABC1/UbiB family)
MLDTFRKNAGMFVKFGQLIASMGVLFPKEYVHSMRNMFQEAPESEWGEVSRILGDALGT